MSPSDETVGVIEFARKRSDIVFHFPFFSFFSGFVDEERVIITRAFFSIPLCVVCVTQIASSPVALTRE